MVRSDNNGAYIVDKKLWGMMMALVGLLMGVVIWGGKSVAGDTWDNTKINATQSIQIQVLTEQRKEMLDEIKEMRVEMREGFARLEKKK